MLALIIAQTCQRADGKAHSRTYEELDNEASANKVRWCGFTASGRCNDQEVEVTTSTTGAGGGTCWEGHKSLCCDKTTSTSGVDDCAWSGSAPFCTTSTALTLGNPLLFFTSASCADGYPDKLTTGKYGYGGDQPCGYNFGFKSYCCKDPSKLSCTKLETRPDTHQTQSRTKTAHGIKAEQTNGLNGSTPST